MLDIVADIEFDPAFMQELEGLSDGSGMLIAFVFSVIMIIVMLLLMVIYYVLLARSNPHVWQMPTLMKGIFLLLFIVSLACLIGGFAINSLTLRLASVVVGLVVSGFTVHYERKVYEEVSL